MQDNEMHILCDKCHCVPSSLASTFTSLMSQEISLKCSPNVTPQGKVDSLTKRHFYPNPLCFCKSVMHNFVLFIKMEFALNCSCVFLYKIFKISFQENIAFFTLLKSNLGVHKYRDRLHRDFLHIIFILPVDSEVQLSS